MILKESYDLKRWGCRRQPRFAGSTSATIDGFEPALSVYGIELSRQDVEGTGRDEKALSLQHL